MLGSVVCHPEGRKLLKAAERYQGPRRNAWVSFIVWEVDQNPKHQGDTGAGAASSRVEGADDCGSLMLSPA